MEQAATVLLYALAMGVAALALGFLMMAGVMLVEWWTGR